ncbi:MAG: Crp/Fnr family transcriptional regulator [Cytophagales bacterium]|nr:Crp/Fnr family transcriptional regulator [Cytophagales bacterium]MDW8384987.1 Crp/Fnr family transcriptional regulator [Flammeovirgaceae bacterium]
MAFSNVTGDILCERCRIRQQSLLRFCTITEINSISVSKSCNTYKRGQEIFHEGSLPLGLFCINSGSIKIVKYASGGKEQIIRIATAGELVGYRSLITRKRYTTSAIAAEDSKVCIIPKDEFYKIIQTNQVFYQAILNALVENLEKAEAKIADVAYKPVRGRIAEALLMLARSNGDDKWSVTLTREDLAGFVGTVKETAIRTLSEFRDEKLIQIDKRTIRILNPEGLERMSNLYD